MCTTETIGLISTIHFSQTPNNVPAYLAPMWTFKEISIESKAHGIQTYNFGGYAKPNILYHVNASDPSIIIQDEGTE